MPVVLPCWMVLKKGGTRNWLGRFFGVLKVGPTKAECHPKRKTVYLEGGRVA